MLIDWFWSNTVIKQQNPEHYMIVQIDPLDILLTTRPIWTGSELCSEQSTHWQFGYIDYPDRIFRDDSVPTWTQTWSSSPEPLLTLPLMTWPTGVQCQKGSYRITLVGVSRDLPTSPTTLITIRNQVISIMRHTLHTAQWQFCWHLFSATSRQFIWFVTLGSQGGDRISYKEIIQFFSEWGQVRIATLSRLLNAFPHIWSVISWSRILNQALKGFVPCFGRFQRGQCIRLLVCWLWRRGISLRRNPSMIEATVVSLFSGSELLISSLCVQS